MPAVSNKSKGGGGAKQRFFGRKGKGQEDTDGAISEASFTAELLQRCRTNESLGSSVEASCGSDAGGGEGGRGRQQQQKERREGGRGVELLLPPLGSLRSSAASTTAASQKSGATKQQPKKMNRVISSLESLLSMSDSEEVFEGSSVSSAGSASSSYNNNNNNNNHREDMYSEAAAPPETQPPCMLSIQMTIDNDNQTLLTSETALEEIMANHDKFAFEFVDNAQAVQEYRRQQQQKKQQQHRPISTAGSKSNYYNSSSKNSSSKNQHASDRYNNNNNNNYQPEFTSNHQNHSDAAVAVPSSNNKSTSNPLFRRLNSRNSNSKNETSFVSRNQLQSKHNGKIPSPQQQQNKQHAQKLPKSSSMIATSQAQTPKQGQIEQRHAPMVTPPSPDAFASPGIVAGGVTFFPNDIGGSVPSSALFSSLAPPTPPAAVSSSSLSSSTQSSTSANHLHQQQQQQHGRRFEQFHPSLAETAKSSASADSAFAKMIAMSYYSLRDPAEAEDPFVTKTTTPPPFVVAKTTTTTPSDISSSHASPYPFEGTLSVAATTTSRFDETRSVASSNWSAPVLLPKFNVSRDRNPPHSSRCAETPTMAATTKSMPKASIFSNLSANLPPPITACPSADSSIGGVSSVRSGRSIDIADDGLECVRRRQSLPAPKQQEQKKNDSNDDNAKKQQSYRERLTAALVPVKNTTDRRPTMPKSSSWSMIAKQPRSAWSLAPPPGDTRKRSTKSASKAILPTIKNNEKSTQTKTSTTEFIVSNTGQAKQQSHVSTASSISTPGSFRANEAVAATIAISNAAFNPPSLFQSYSSTANVTDNDTAEGTVNVITTKRSKSVSNKDDLAAPIDVDFWAEVEDAIEGADTLMANTTAYQGVVLTAAQNSDSVNGGMNLDPNKNVVGAAALLASAKTASYKSSPSRSQSWSGQLHIVPHDHHQQEPSFFVGAAATSELGDRNNFVKKPMQDFASSKKQDHLDVAQSATAQQSNMVVAAYTENNSHLARNDNTDSGAETENNCAGSFSKGVQKGQKGSTAEASQGLFANEPFASTAQTPQFSEEARHHHSRSKVEKPNGSGISAAPDPPEMVVTQRIKDPTVNLGNRGYTTYASTATENISAPNLFDLPVKPNSHQRMPSGSAQIKEIVLLNPVGKAENEAELVAVSRASTMTIDEIFDDVDDINNHDGRGVDCDGDDIESKVYDDPDMEIFEDSASGSSDDEFGVNTSGAQSEDPSMSTMPAGNVTTDSMSLAMNSLVALALIETPIKKSTNKRSNLQIVQDSLSRQMRFHLSRCPPDCRPLTVRHHSKQPDIIDPLAIDANCGRNLEMQDHETDESIDFDVLSSSEEGDKNGNDEFGMNSYCDPQHVHRCVLKHLASEATNLTIPKDSQNDYSMFSEDSVDSRSQKTLICSRFPPQSFSKAITLYESLWAQQRKHKHPQVAETLSRLTVLCIMHGRLKDAAKYCSQAQKIRRENARPMQDAVCTMELGTVHFCAGRLKEAIRCWREALQMACVAMGYDHPHIAILLNNIGVLHYQAGDMSSAKRALEESLALQKTTLRTGLGGGGNGLMQMGIIEHGMHQLATTVGNLAIVIAGFSGRGDGTNHRYEYSVDESYRDKAIALLQESSSLFGSVFTFSGDSIERNIAHLSDELSLFPKSGEEGLEVKEDGSLLQATSKNACNATDSNLKSARPSEPFGDSDGIPTKFSPMVLDSLDFLFLGPIHEETTSADQVNECMSMWLGKLFGQDLDGSNNSKHDSSVPESAVARTKSSIIVDVDEANIVDAEQCLDEVHTQAMIHLEDDEIDDAIDVISGALLSHIEKFGTNHHLVGNAYHNIGMINLFAKRYPEAQASFERAVKIRTSCFGEGHHDVCASIMKIGMVQYAQGKLRDAAQTFWVVRDNCIAGKLGYGHPLLPKVMNNIGVVASAQGEIFEATRSLEIAYEYQNCQNDPEWEESQVKALSTAHLMANLGYACAKQGVLDIALQYFEDALSVYKDYVPENDYRRCAVFDNIESFSNGKAATLAAAKSKIGSSPTSTADWTGDCQGFNPICIDFKMWKLTDNSVDSI